MVVLPHLFLDPYFHKINSLKFWLSLSLSFSVYEKLFPVSSLPPEQQLFSSFSPGSHNTPEPTLPSSAHHHYYILEQNSSHNVASPTSSEERVYDVPEVGIPLENTVQNDTDDEDPTYDDVVPVIR